jgi:lipopolysaccharide transport system permease protein
VAAVVIGVAAGALAARRPVFAFVATNLSGMMRAIPIIAFLAFAIPYLGLGFTPAFVALAMLASLGPAFLITALNVKYRDFRYIIPFIVQLGLYISPVGFSSAIVPDRWRFLYSLNPVVGVIDGFRWCVLGGASRLYLPGFLLSLLVVALFLWLGTRYFRHTEKSFADLI